MTRKLLALAFLVLATTAGAAETSRYLVATRGSARNLRPASMAVDLEERGVRRFRHVDAFAADLTEAEAEAMRRSPDVIAVEPVMPRHIFSTGIRRPVAVNAASPERTPWGMEAINAPAVWAVTMGDKAVNVAVIDTGIDPTHVELKHAYAGGYHAYKDGEAPIDDNGHGTHVSGTIVAQHNGIGVVGVAPNVSLWAVKVLDLTGWGNTEWVVEGIDWVIAKKRQIGGRWVANMSIGADRPSVIERDAIMRAEAEGIILVAASGNTGYHQSTYPGGYPGVISVGALAEDRRVADFSTYGMDLTLVAPGVEVESTLPFGLFSLISLDTNAGPVVPYKVGKSPFGTVTAGYVECAYGREGEFPAEVEGRIALIKRGPRGSEGITFQKKVENAKDAGAIGVVLFNDDDIERADYASWTFGDTAEAAKLVPTVALSNRDGEKLRSASDARSITLSFESEDYAFLNGTSMATPHVTGTVALLLSLAPNATAGEIHSAIQRTARDVEQPGWDPRSSWGLLDTLAAAKQIAPAAFGGTPTTPKATKRRSSTP